MPQARYLRLSHFKPEGYPEIYPGSSDEVKKIMPDLIKQVSLRWTKISNYNLEAFTTQNMNVPCLAFRKDNKEVFLHIFCNEFMNPIYAIQIVSNLYKKLDLGNPSFSTIERNWIHTIPLPGRELSSSEELLIHQLAQSLFWTIFMDYKQNT